MAKILRSETSLGRRQRELEDAWRHSGVGTFIVWGLVALLLIILIPAGVI